MVRDYILLVDDGPMEVELTLAAIARLSVDIDVKVVNDGAQALDFLYRRNAYANLDEIPPKLILLDLKMPKVNGLQVLQKVKSDPDLLSTPIIVLSSSEQDKDIRESYGYGANAYVVKPIVYEEFVKTIKTILHFWLNISQTAQSI